MKILIVEDNARLAERVHYHLSKYFHIDIACTGKEALERARTIDYSVIVLDIGLPDLSGLSVCKILRKEDNSTPIIILSGLNAVTTRVELLNAGADDYLTKPFEIPELHARINALSRRRTRHKPTPLLVCGDIVVNTEQRTTMHGETPVPLRRKEFDILCYLMKNKGRIMTRQMIMDNVWSSTSNSWLSTIDVHVKHLRDKVDRPFHTSYIKTVYGLGYKIDDQTK